MFVIFPRLCQNLYLYTIFRQLWTNCGSDSEVGYIHFQNVDVRMAGLTTRLTRLQP